MKACCSLIALLAAAVVISGSCAQNQYSAADIGPRTEIAALMNYSRILYISVTTGSDQEGDGSAEKPWHTLPFALARAKTADAAHPYAVLVGKGNYTGETIRMQPHVDLFGGFDPISWERDILSHRTVLAGVDSHRVLVGADHARLDGFVISKGRVRGKGAGLYCDGVSPSITNNVFIANKTLAPIPWKPKYLHATAHDGGAIYCRNGASPTIENNVFASNSTECGRGAAIAMESRCAGRIVGNLFYNNITGLKDPMRSSDGGAVSLFDWSSPLVDNNIFLQNQSLTSNDAGGLFVALWSSPVISKNLFLGNESGDDAGALFVGGQEHRYDSPLDPLPDRDRFFVEISDNVFIGNSNPSKNSGAMRFTMESRGSFRNNLVAHNSGIYFQRCEATIEDNRILDNFLLIETKIGLQPCIIRNNLIWGELTLETSAMITDNNLKKKLDGNTSIPPRFKDDWIELRAYSVIFDPKVCVTTLMVSGTNFQQNELANRIVKSGERWGVIKANLDAQVEIWGDLSGCLQLTLMPTFNLEK